SYATPPSKANRLAARGWTPRDPRRTMRAMRTMTFLALLACVAGAAFAGDDGAPLTGRVSDRSRICMMQDSVQPKAGVSHEYQGKTYWLCCEMCVQSFGADPEKFA